jgi:hypothetical protein
MLFLRSSCVFCGGSCLYFCKPGVVNALPNSHQPLQQAGTVAWLPYALARAAYGVNNPGAHGCCGFAGWLQPAAGRAPGQTVSTFSTYADECCAFCSHFGNDNAKAGLIVPNHDSIKKHIIKKLHNSFIMNQHFF